MYDHQERIAINSRESITKRFTSNAVVVLFARIITFVAVFGFNAILARVLTPADFGIFALLFSVATLACMVASCGMNRGLVIVLASEGQQLGTADTRRILKFAIKVAFVAGVAVGVFAFVVVLSQLQASRDSITSLAVLFGCIVLFRNLHFVIAETMRGFHESKWSNFFGGPAGGPIPHLLFTVVLLVIWQSGIQLTLPLVLTSYLACYVLLLAPLTIRFWALSCIERTGDLSVIDDSSPTQPVRSLRSIWILALPLMLTQSFGLTLSQADVWLAGALVLPATLAIYCAAQRMLGFLTIPLQISNTAIISLVPELVSRKRTAELQKVVGLATFVSSVPALMIGTVLLIFPEQVLAVAFGEYYSQAAPILRLLVVGQLVCVLTGPSETILMMAGCERMTLIVNVVVAFAIVGLASLGISLNGVMGLAIAIALITILQNVFTCWLTAKYVGVKSYFQPNYAHQFWNEVQTRFFTPSKAHAA